MTDLIMEEQSKEDKSFSSTKGTGNTNTSDLYQKRIVVESSHEISENSDSSPRDFENDSCQIASVYVNNSTYEKPLEPTLRMTIPNPKRTLMPLDKPSHCDICGKKFARANQCQQHRKTHFTQNSPVVTFPVPVDDKSFSQNMSSTLSSPSHYSNSAPSYLDIHKMAVEQIQAAAAAAGNTDNNDLDQKFDPSTDPYLLSLGSVVSSTSSSSSSSSLPPPPPPPPRENFFYSNYPCTMTHRDQVLTSESSVNQTFSNSPSSNFKASSGPLGGGPEKPFTCEICQKAFARRDTLICHRRTHDGTKPFRCKICDKGFSRRDKLQCHSRVHSGEKPYSCLVCNRAFAQSDKLKCHMRTHTGERPHPCDLCDKRFARRDTLHCHRRTHTGEKPFPCNICGKRFARRDKLTCHKRVHSGEKPYECGTCGKQFARSDKLCRHRRIHNTDRTLASGNGLSVNINNPPHTPSTSSLTPLATANPESAITSGVSLPDMEISSKILFPQQGLPPVFPTIKEYSNLGNILWQTIY